jgi:hypothetical protein
MGTRVRSRSPPFLLDTARTLDGALAVVRPFINLILDGTAAGSWERNSRRWIR